ncbi:hypothetical protein FN846DRAFT_893413 [Sphaerosporella brunnea]|uniref:Uncharacterized protein n=1 Tax=Sphaerosporella brunnea TaxID=1250544 RepID=A0A5J5EM79_9PEZI|nr:hypothetical protein FN846DRAFT_893413 [Sphaerosporella brunnea]
MGTDDPGDATGILTTALGFLGLFAGDPCPALRRFAGDIDFARDSDLGGEPFSAPLTPSKPHLLARRYPASRLRTANDAKFLTLCPICHHKFRGGQERLAQLRQHLSQTVPEFLARIGGRARIQTCIPDLDAQNLIRVLLHCDKGFRGSNNLPPGGVDMAPLNAVPRFWWRFF